MTNRKETQEIKMVEDGSSAFTFLAKGRRREGGGWMMLGSGDMSFCRVHIFHRSAYEQLLLNGRRVTTIRQISVRSCGSVGEEEEEEQDAPQRGMFA